MDTVRYEGDRIRGTGAAPYLEAVKKKYADRNAWESETLRRLRSWGFNTLGAWYQFTGVISIIACALTHSG